MKKIVYWAVVTFVICGLVFMSGCKTSKQDVVDFSIVSLSGYSKNVTSLDPDDKGLTSINLFFSIRNLGDISGTITGWSFRIKDNIVTLVEINHNNYQNFNLTFSGNPVVSPDPGRINEIFVETPPPFEANALSADKLSFAPYTPKEVILEVEVTKDNGEVETITARGAYTYERDTTNESKYNIIGQWEFKRVVKGENKAKQKIDFVGTKMSGKYVIYDFDTNNVDETGTYVVTSYKFLTFTSNNGTQYWGEFTDPTHMGGTLLIPENKRQKQESQTGTWSGKKL